MASLDTKMILADSLVSLLKEKPIEKITIQEIVDQSGFNRQTFYYHFTDIFDLLEWILKRRYGLLSEHLIFDAEEPLITKIEKLFDHLSENRIVFLHSYNPKYRYYYEGIIRPWIHEQIKKIIENAPLSKEILPEERKFITDSFTWVFIGLFFEWLEKGMPKQRRESIEDYYLLIQVSIDASLKAFAEKNRSLSHKRD